MTSAPTENTDNNPLGSVPINILLARFAIPSIIAMLVSALYNIVDQFFIGRSVGMLGNAATNVAFPLTITCTAVSLMCGIGGSANFTTSLPASIFGRHGFDKVNSVIFPIQGLVTSLCFAVNGIVLNLTGDLRYAYLVFAGVAAVNTLLVLFVDEHKYNKDWHAAKKPAASSLQARECI